MYSGHGKPLHGDQAGEPILTVPEELAVVEPVALTGNFWVSLPDLDPATGAARSVGVLSAAARALIEFTGAVESPGASPPPGAGAGSHPRGTEAGTEAPSGPLLVPLVEYRGRLLWPPAPAPQAERNRAHRAAAGTAGPAGPAGEGDAADALGTKGRVGAMGAAGARDSTGSAGEPGAPEPVGAKTWAPDTSGPRVDLRYLGGWIPRWLIDLPGPPALRLELTWLAPVDQRGFAVALRLLPAAEARPAAVPCTGVGAGGTGMGHPDPATGPGPSPAGRGDVLAGPGPSPSASPPAVATEAGDPGAEVPSPAAVRLGLLARPGTVFRTVYHRRPLPGDPGPYPYRWTRALAWEAPGTVPVGALALRSATGDEPVRDGIHGGWVFWSPPGAGELVVYGGVAPEADGAATTAVHLARVGWPALLARTLQWLGARDPFRPLGPEGQPAGEPEGGPEEAPTAAPPGSSDRKLPVEPAPSAAGARPGGDGPAVEPITPQGAREEAPDPIARPEAEAVQGPLLRPAQARLRRAGLAQAVALGLLGPSEARTLEEVLRRNLWFSLFYANGRTLDGDDWVLLTSRSPRYYVSGAHWTRDSLFWAFPAVLATDPRLARELLVAGFTRYTRYPGEHSQYLDGTVLYPGWELDQAAAWPLSLARYLEATGDASVLDEPAVVSGLGAVLQAAEAYRDPATGLVATFLLPSDDPAQAPFVTYDNALYAQALEDLARTVARWTPVPGGTSVPAATSVPGEPRVLGGTHVQAGSPGTRAGRPGPWLDPGWLQERAEHTRQAVLAHCVVAGPWGPQFAWAVAGPGGAGAVFYDEPPGTLELLGPYGFARRRPGDPVDVEAVYANTVRWIYSEHNPYGPPPGPFATPTCPHARHPWLLSVAAGLLAGRRRYLGWLARVPMDSGFACETVDAATGQVRTGPAFATCAGFVTWAALVALERLAGEEKQARGAAASGEGRAAPR